MTKTRVKLASIGIFVAAILSSSSARAQLKLAPPANSRGENNVNQLDAAFLDGDWDEPLMSVLENGPAVQPTTSGPLRTPKSPSDNTFPVSTELNQLLTGIVLKHMPHQYLEDKKWGKQVKRWDGIEFRRDGEGSRLETKRRYKMVNHGTWQKYAAELADPQQQFSVELKNVSRTADGKTVFDVGFAADLKLNARQSKWVKGVQLYSFSADGSAKVRLTVSCEMEIGLDFGNFPPDLVFMPKITDAKIEVDEFGLRRVSKAGGEIAQQIARRAKKELDAKIEEKERKLVQKMNKEIDENQDELRLSTADAIKLKWYSQTRDFLPEEVRRALTK